MVTAAMKLKDACSLEEKLMTNLDSILKSKDIYLPTKVHLVQAMIFSSSHVWVWQLDYKESWTLKWVAISFSNAWNWKVKVKLLSRVQPLATSWTAAYQAPLSMG